MKNVGDKVKEITKTKGGMIGLFAGLFLVAVGVSWLFFSLVVTNKPISSGNVNNTRSRINPNLPKTEACPINGQKYTVEEKAIWEGRRPATVVVENHIDARPINGLSKADFVYETVAEGGITRFSAVFYCGTAAEDVRVAPVRSARVYFINWAAEYGDKPLYVHVGGANDFGENGGSKPAGQIDPRVNAISLLEKLGWRVLGGNDYDTGWQAGYPVLAKDPERNRDIVGHLLASEHTTFLSTDELHKDAESKDLGATSEGVSWTKGFVPYNFVDDAKASSPAASSIKFDFWTSQPDYSVEWKYDPTNNQYLRFNAGASFVDVNYNNVQIAAKNVVVMEVDEIGPVDAEGHMIEENIGEGDAFIFQNGNVIKGTWSKETRTSRTIFSDEDGKQISFVRGQTWVEAIPTGNTVDYN